MNQKICKTIVENKDNFIPNLFTARQINILEKYLKKGRLTKTEKGYLYSAIRKKIDALTLLKEECFIRGENMIPERLKKAKKILRELHKEKAFISGSFLFAKKFNDVDIYIISKKRKQYHKGKKHFIFITEEDLKKPVFISALKYSISNFFIEETEPLIKRLSFNDLVMTYELAVNEILDNDDQKSIRDILFEYHMHIKGVILDSFSLHNKIKEIIKLKRKEKIALINEMTKELLLKIYSNKYMYNELTGFVKQIKKSVNDFVANDNLIIYSNFLDGVKNACRGIKA